MAVRDTQSQENNGQFGRGLGVQDGAQVEVIRAVFERNRDVGVYNSGAGTVLILADAAMSATCLPKAHVLPTP